jgi:hypothetical protein
MKPAPSKPLLPKAVLPKPVQKMSELLPRRLFYRRQARFAALAVGILGLSLGMGVLGYHVTEGLGWLDSLLNASMLLGGMGPLEQPATVAGKWFASFYALFSGVIFLVAVSVLVAPLAHRLFHHFHLDMGDGRSRK